MFESKRTAEEPPQSGGKAVDDQAILEMKAHLIAQDIVLEILCAQVWSQLSPQKMELVGQRYIRMLQETVASTETDVSTDAVIAQGEKILNNAMIRSPKLRSTI